MNKTCKERLAKQQKNFRNRMDAQKIDFKKRLSKDRQDHADRMERLKRQSVELKDKLADSEVDFCRRIRTEKRKYDDLVNDDARVSTSSDENASLSHCEIVRLKRFANKLISEDVVDVRGGSAMSSAARFYGNNSPKYQRLVEPSLVEPGEDEDVSDLEEELDMLELGENDMEDTVFVTNDVLEMIFESDDSDHSEKELV